MRALILARWVATRWAREPLKWAICAALAGFWSAIHLLAPFGESPLQWHVHALNYELAYMAAGIGTACALDSLEVLPACAQALGLRPRWVWEWGALLAGGLAAQVVVLAIPLALMLGRDASLDIGLVLDMTACSAYLAALGLVLLRIHMPRGSRAWVLIALTCVLPLLSQPLNTTTLLGTATSPTVGPGSAAMRLASEIALISALLLGVHLMDARRWRHA
jgi:hypothetical protein